MILSQTAWPTIGARTPRLKLTVRASSFENKQGDPYLQLLEDRISNAKLSREQKDLARRLAAISLDKAPDAKQKMKAVKAILMLIEIWESQSDKEEKEDPKRIKHIDDYIKELHSSEKIILARSKGEQEAAQLLDRLQQQLDHGTPIKEAASNRRLDIVI